MLIIVDMRWGVADSMAPLANDICIEEIKKCNETSFGPAFVSLLSSRSGSKFLQGKISQIDFEIIHNKLNEEEKELMNQFYKLDLNYGENPMYLLTNEIVGSGNSKIKISHKNF